MRHDHFTTSAGIHGALEVLFFDREIAHADYRIILAAQTISSVGTYLFVIGLRLKASVRMLGRCPLETRSHFV